MECGLTSPDVQKKNQPILLSEEETSGRTTNLTIKCKGFYTTLTIRAFDNIINDAALPRHFDSII